MICEWCSSPFPQNSFSPISFTIPFYSLFHPPFLPISTPSPSSPLIPAFHYHSHLCSLCIHSHLSLLLNHFNHTHSYPFPFQSSHSIPFHHSHSFPIRLLTLYYLAFSGFLPFIFHRSISFHAFQYSHSIPFHPLHSILVVSSLLFFVSQL